MNHDDHKQTPSRPHTGRTRNALARQAVLEAALDLAAEDLPGLTVNRIAERAGVGKQTMYRWWPSKWAVLLDALLERAETEVRADDAGERGPDPVGFLATLFATVGRPDGTADLLRALMAQAQVDTEFAVLWRERFILPRRRALTDVLAKARGVGLLPEATDVETACDLLFGGMWYRLLVGHAPLDAAWAAQAVRALGASGGAQPVSTKNS
ncbi:TetR/AcrR family transcriptional regulator [Streptomyces sp. NPDC001781]